MNFYMINTEEVLNGKKVDSSSKIFWVSNDKDARELSDAFKELGKTKTANSISKGFAYVFSAGITSQLREEGKLEEKKASAAPQNINDAIGLKVYDETHKVMEVYERFPCSIFRAMKNDNTLVGKNGEYDLPKDNDEQQKGSFWNWFGARFKPRT